MSTVRYPPASATRAAAGHALKAQYCNQIRCIIRRVRVWIYYDDISTQQRHIDAIGFRQLRSAVGRESLALRPRTGLSSASTHSSAPPSESIDQDAAIGLSDAA